jgi:hypothetical protein
MTDDRERRHDLSLPLDDRLRTNLVMPRAAERAFRALDGQFLGLCFRWMVFKQLYVSGEKRIALMNEKAPGFFAHLQPIWLDGVVLGVTRLLDPAQMRGRLNLTFKQLVNRLEGEEHDYLDALSNGLGELSERCQPFHTHRNKRIAHSDYNALTSVGDYPFPTLPPEQIDGMLGAMEAFMNLVRNRYDLGNMAYTGVQGAPGADGDALLWSLAKAAAWDDRYGNVMENARRLRESRYPDVWGS